MTIAACYISPEGVVLGADSTSSTVISAGPNTTGYHYFNHNQKLFEVGENSTVGLITWGLGGLSTASYRTLIATLADDIRNKPVVSVRDIADRWAQIFWTAYTAEPSVLTCKSLGAKPAHDPNNPTSRTKDEEQQLAGLRWNLAVGFCLAGYWLPDRTPSAFQLVFDPLVMAPPSPTQISNYSFWGAPNMIKRLINGIDDNLKDMILKSGKWAGTGADLEVLIDQNRIGHPVLPIRDAIDFVHACISSTIKAMKFSNFFQVCGGPIEIAVITSDRQFRWVRHKQWDAAITEGAQ